MLYMTEFARGMESLFNSSITSLNYHSFEKAGTKWRRSHIGEIQSPLLQLLGRLREDRTKSLSMAMNVILKVQVR